jgi:hypothetical protein
VIPLSGTFSCTLSGWLVHPGSDNVSGLGSWWLLQSSVAVLEGAQPLMCSSLQHSRFVLSADPTCDTWAPCFLPADMLAQLRSAQEEAARLKKELAVLQQQQPVRYAHNFTPALFFLFYMILPTTSPKGTAGAVVIPSLVLQLLWLPRRQHNCTLVQDPPAAAAGRGAVRSGRPTDILTCCCCCCCCWLRCCGVVQSGQTSDMSAKPRIDGTGDRETPWSK